MKKFVSIAFVLAMLVETGCGVFPIQGGGKRDKTTPAYSPPSKSHPFPIDRHRNTQVRKHKHWQD